MNDVPEQLWTWTAHVVAMYFATGRSPREAMAASVVLRVATSSERAAVAAHAAATVTALRRLEAALAGPGFDGRSPPDRALALVLGSAVERDLLLADGAARRFVARCGEPSPEFARLLARPTVPADEPAPAFAVRHSLPDWFVPLVRADFGAEAEAVCRALAGPAPRTVRANLLRVASRAELAAELAAEGVPTRPGPFAPTALHVDGDADLFGTAAYARGAFEQQDEASQLCALVVAPPPAGKVLDLCAGSGGKTLALAAALQNRGQVLASDVHRGRLDALRQRLRHAGAQNVQCAWSREDEPAAAVREFAPHADRILVDAPCSGTGSWRRRPEARWGLDRRSFDALRTTQAKLLDLAAAALRPGARLVYATCSLLADENERQVEALCTRHPALEVVRLAEILGSATALPITDATGTFLSLRPDRHGCDGFFAAVLRRPRR